MTTLDSPQHQTPAAADLRAENRELRAYLKAFCAATIDPEDRGKDVEQYEANPFIEYEFTCLCDDEPRPDRVITGGQVRRAMELIGFDKLNIEPADKTISQELTEARDLRAEVKALRGAVAIYAESEAKLVAEREALAASPPQAETPGRDREAVARIRAAEDARDEAVSTLKTWFDTKDYVEADLVNKFAEGISGYLRTSRCGGLSKKDSDRAEAVVQDFMRLYGAGIVAPVISRNAAILAATAVSQPPTSRQGAGEVEALRAAVAVAIEDLNGTAAKVRAGASGDKVAAWIEMSIRDLLPAQPGPALAETIRLKMAEPCFVAFGEALRGNLTEAGHLLAFKVRPTGTASMWVRLVSGREIIVGEDEWTPAQPGLAPVGDGGAIEALKCIAALSPEPDDKTWRNDWNEPAAYRWFGTDGEIHETGVDTSNHGDIESWAYEKGQHAAAVIARAALDSIPAAGGADVPKGWRLVPVEPTEEMVEAFWIQTGESNIMRSRVQDDGRRKYTAMLAAAPLPAAPTQTAREGGE